MGKTSKWLRSILTGKKDKVKDSDKYPKTTDINPQQDRTTTTTTPKEKRRWSFRRSSTSSTTTTTATGATPPPPAESNAVTFKSQPTDIAADDEQQQLKHDMAVAAAAGAAAAAISLTAAVAAAIKIQSVFRSYLARKALCALRGLVKLQALVRGHLVRKQATDTLRRMQALVTAQARARAHRIQMVLSKDHNFNNNDNNQRRHLQQNMFTQIYDEIDMNQEENIKIVEMDVHVCETKGDGRRRRNNMSNNNYNPNYHHAYYSQMQEAQWATSPSPSTLTDMSPRAYSGHFEDGTSLGTAQSSPQLCCSAVSKPEDPKNLPFTFPKPPPYAESVMPYDYPLFPNYMANTESSRAKVRSQSAPKQRPPETSFERQPSRRRASVEGRNVPRPVRMQRSSSHVGSTAHNYQYPWSVIRLDKSSASLNNSECGSSSTVLTNTNYCKSLAAFDPYGGRYYN